MGAVVSFQPVGSAPVDDAARQGLFSQFFFSSGDLLAGIDDSPRMVPGGGANGQLGPGTTLGVDIGVGTNGEVYIRGRAGEQAAATAPAAPTVAGVAITPGLLLIAGLAFLLLRK